MGLFGVNKFVGGDLCDPLNVGAQMKGKLQQVACYRAVGTKGRWDLEEKREL